MSSRVMIRSVVGTNAASALSSVVFPDEVAPLTNRLHRAATTVCSSSTTPGSAKADSGSGRIAKRRMVRHGPSTAMGSITAHTREPSGRRPSTVGFERSSRRPIGRRMCSMAVATADALMVATRSNVPERSIHTSPAPLTITSSIAGSPSQRSRPPSGERSAMTSIMPRSAATS